MHYHQYLQRPYTITIKKWISIGKKLILTARDRLALTNELSDIRITAITASINSVT